MWHAGDLVEQSFYFIQRQDRWQPTPILRTYGIDTLRNRAFRQHRYAIFVALAGTYRELSRRDIDILDAQ